ncbi:uncharacterized protein B0H18DRAFT_880310 [Fomitopsis serialis]|uniref:uncharacterized protein n=1 Tax=Fomitopsis serialis TaxID=139415 RepID=UPI002007A778|nr:uncharacterized protein B0H18DRAFT_880310 [Neoantrodia serialis]KAH9921295.1 hypothetical protein B0H18DRAFT_880310 [Neoantrodia serialis]
MAERNENLDQAQTRVRHDTSLYNAAALKDEVVLQDAIRDLEHDLEYSAVSVEDVVKGLSQYQHLLEFVLSAVNEAAAKRIGDWIVSSVPDNALAYVSSTARQLLGCFSLSLHFLILPTSSPIDKAVLRDNHQDIQRVTAALESLALHSFDRNETTEDTLDLDEEVVIKIVSSKQKKKRRSRQPQLKTVTDTKPFDELGIETPESQDEAAVYYLGVFRLPGLQETFKRAYIPLEETEQGGPESLEVSVEASVPDIPATDEIPVAYPMVQPMKAALYFDNADGFGEWRILISTRADTDLRYMRKKNTALFDITLNKIKALSNGHFSQDNQKQLTDAAQVPIYEAKMTGDSRLVYQVDCVSEYESDVSALSSVIKVFGIYTHAQINRRFWDGVGHQLSRKGKQYRDRCKYRNRPTKVGEHAHVILPATFPAPLEAPTLSPSSGLPDLHKDDLQKVLCHRVLDPADCFCLSVTTGILADQDVVHVFDVSPQEKQIIEHPGSCYVLGRSGTGKTTTMLFKILGIERSWNAQKDTSAKPRQMFVTQSRVLADKVQDYYSKLHDSLSSADKQPEELRELALTRAARQDQGLVDRDEEIERRADLPKRYSELGDEHFPMFITFDQLCRLLETEYADFMKDSQQPLLQTIASMSGAADGESSSNEPVRQHRAAFVSYKVFMNSYWRHFPQPLTKGLDPALVFGEIIGIIKGSEQALSSTKGFLMKDAYFNLSHRTQGTFANHRETIYKLFAAYMKRKRERREYDAADRTHVILNALREYGLPGKQMDFLYIDEAQDNLLIDALVIRSLCSNPDSGLFWAGDTAQTIAVGSAFRFDDLKSFLYRIEVLDQMNSPGPRPQPQAFQLAFNYRSHAGIVNCARSVVELLTKFWPHAIDNLGEERGIIDGLKPVFFTGWDDDNVRYEQFLFGDSGSQIEFGAQQCIMVRDDAAKEKLQAQIGNIGLIMTPYESKGLEFNDVLLYNFFADSTVDLSQWRVVLNALPQGSGEALRAPRFDDSRHNGVCRELKILYVAITRARQNLWIADNSDKSEPMRILWGAKGQIQNCTPGSDVPRLAMSSTPEEWARTARTLFDNRRYTQAMHCYERALLPRERAVAEAYYLREKARGTPVDARGDDFDRILAFRKAAEAFWRSADAAAKEKTTYFRISAECYLESRDEVNAAHGYRHAAEYTLSAQCYRRAGMFDDAVAIVKGHNVVAGVAESIINVSRLEYARGGKLKQARELFESDEEILEFLDDRGLYVSQVDLLDELGQFGQVAELHLTQGHVLEAIAAFLKDHSNPDSAKRASQCVLDGIWQGLSLGVDTSSELVKANVTLQELLQRLQHLDISHLEDGTRDEVLMFRAIATNNRQQLLILGERFHRWHRNDAAAILCLDHAFFGSLNFAHATLPAMATVLKYFQLYAQILWGLASREKPSDTPEIRRIFGFAPETDSEDFFVVQKDTVLYTFCSERIAPSVRPHEQGIAILRSELDRVLRRALQERLRKNVVEENESCRNARVFRVCLPHAAFGHCPRSDHCPQIHIAAERFDTDLYNLRVRICLQQILIYNTVYGVEPFYEQARHRRFWLRLLHEALEPSFYKMGSLPNLQVASIPEFEAAIQVVRNWTIDWLYTAHPRAGEFTPTFLTSLLRIVSLGVAFDRGVLGGHLPRAIAVRAYRPIPLLRGRGEHASYVVHDMCRLMMNNHRASLPSGVLFLNHILDKRLAIDIGVLCNFMDHLCTLLTLATALNKLGTLHEITLPRTWLQRVADDLPVLYERKIMAFYLYTGPMTSLLKQLYTGLDADHLLYENRNMSMIGWQIKSIFITRVYVLIFTPVAYNSPHMSVKLDVHKIVTSLQRYDGRFDILLGSYVTAPCWDNLAWEVRQCLAGSSMDEMIQIHEAGKSTHHSQLLPGVRRIVYNKLDEIPILLASGATSLPKSTLRVDAAPFVPSQMQKPQPASAFDDADAPEEVNEEDVAFEIRDDHVASSQPSEDEIKAADVIRKSFLHHRSRVQQRTTTKPLDAIRERIMNSYRTAAMNMEWPHRYYRMLFLGPIPHAFFCLERVRHHMHETKRQAKRRLVDAIHQELEEVDGRLTKCSQQIKEVTRLINALKPDAELHKKRDLDGLRARIGEVQILAESLPKGAALEWEEDLELAVKGIVKPHPPPAPPAKKPKPTLNLDDDMVCYEDIVYSGGDFA